MLTVIAVQRCVPRCGKGVKTVLFPSQKWENPTENTEGVRIIALLRCCFPFRLLLFGTGCATTRGISAGRE